MLVEVSCALELEIFPRLSWFELRLLGFRLRVYIARRMKDVFRVIFNCPGVITSIILTPDLKKYKAVHKHGTEKEFPTKTNGPYLPPDHKGRHTILKCCHRSLPTPLVPEVYLELASSFVNCEPSTFDCASSNFHRPCTPPPRRLALLSKLFPS